MQSFEDLNDQIVYTNVKSRGDAVKLKEHALGAVAAGKTVVIFFENRYHLHLAPGQDPYQVRQDIDNWMNKKDKGSSVGATDSETISTGSKTTSARPRLR